jgi:hypothetical protein
MENKYLSKVATQENDKNFRNYLDQTISILGNREKEELDKREQLRKEYKKELQVQMVQQKDHHNRMWDEMGE